MTPLAFKRGDTFRLPVVYSDDDDNPIDVSTYTITCHVRKSSGDALVAECDFEDVDSANGSFVFVTDAEDTALWGLGLHYLDLRYADASGAVVHSDSVEFVVEREATRS